MIIIWFSVIAKALNDKVTENIKINMDLKISDKNFFIIIIFYKKL
tara:strand:+ start:15306 stop:15440 length:135 start_codon:yes stop_codon:yes gene_type:complete